jgi:hypothetical protein
MYRLAKDLGRTLDEIMEMNRAEFIGWAAFYRWEAEEMKKASRKK